MFSLQWNIPQQGYIRSYFMHQIISHRPVLFLQKIFPHGLPRSSPDIHPVHCAKIDPDTAYMVCISVSLGFPYMVSIFPCFPYMVSVFPCFPYMVMLPKHLNVKTILLDRELLWAAMDATMSQGPLLWRHNDKTVIVSWNTRGPTFPWNNFKYILTQL